MLNRVAAGEEIEIVRNGAVAALLCPPKRRLLSAERFRELLDTAPPVDDEFATDLRRIRRGSARRRVPGRPDRHRPPGRSRAWCAGSPRVSTGRPGPCDQRHYRERAASRCTSSDWRCVGPAACFVEHVIAVFDPIPITEFVARVHAEVWVELTRRGEAVGAHDLWIAATALAHGLVSRPGMPPSSGASLGSVSSRRSRNVRSFCHGRDIRNVAHANDDPPEPAYRREQ